MYSFLCFSAHLCRLRSTIYMYGNLNRLRRSKHTIRTLPSTSCATVRYMLSIGKDKRLVEMLEDRYAYGLFLDVPTANLLIDHFLTAEAKELEAAKVSELLC